MSFSKNGYKNWWRKRIIGVFIPYWIVQFISYFFIKDLKIQQIIFDFILIKPLHPLGWYLNYLLLWYLTFYIVHFIRNEKIQWSIFILVSILYALYFEIKSPIRFEQSLSFVSGCYFAKRTHNRDGISRQGVVMLFSIATLCLGLKQIPEVRAILLAENFLNLFVKFFYALAILFFCSFSR